MKDTTFDRGALLLKYVSKMYADLVKIRYDRDVTSKEGDILAKYIIEVNKEITVPNPAIAVALIETINWIGFNKLHSNERIINRVLNKLSKVKPTQFIIDTIMYLVYGNLYEDRALGEVKTDYEKAMGMYDYIPYGRVDYANLILALKSAGYSGKFIDVGCGIGDKCILASIYGGFDTYGIEYNATTLKLAHDQELN